MPGTIKLMSWNINNFGIKKTNDEFYSYVSTTIMFSGADIVGLIEIVGMQGDTIARNLVAYLSGWDAVVSDQFLAGGHSEQYIILYNQKTMGVRGNYGLVGLVNEHDFDAVLVKLGISPQNEDEVAKFNQNLMKHRYLDRSFRVPRATWALLNQGQAVKVDEITKDKVILAEIKQVLLRSKPYVFPNWGDRTPFYCHFTMPDGNPLSVYLFHAPKPASGRNVNVFYGVNHLGLITDLAGPQDIVVMGDFNVKHPEIDGIQIDHEILDNQGQMVKTGQSVTPFQTLTGPDSGVYTFLRYEKQLDNVPTSMVTVPLSPGTTDPEKAYSSAYDNFYVKRHVTANPQSFRYPVLEFLSSPLGLTRYEAVKVYSRWRKQELRKKQYFNKKKKFPFPEIKDEDLNLQEAFYVYRCALSDHAPVLLSIDYV